MTNTKTLNLYKNYPFDTNPFAVRHFSYDMFDTSHVHVKKGAPFVDHMAAILGRMHAMGFDEYFIWKRLPVEAGDWGKGFVRLKAAQLGYKMTRYFQMPMLKWLPLKSSTWKE